MDSPIPPPDATSHASLEASRHGVYRLLVKPRKGFSLGYPDKNFLVDACSQILRFMADIYSLGPRLFVTVVLARIFFSLEPALTLWASGLILSTLEEGLVRGNPDTQRILYASCMQVTVVIASGISHWFSNHARTQLKHRTKQWFQEEMMKADILMDLAAAQERNKPGSDGFHSPWQAFERILSTVGGVVGVMGQLGFLFSLFSSQSSGLFFLLLCLGHPVYEEIFRPALWTTPFVAYAVDKNFLYMKSLKKLTSVEFRAEVLGGDLVGFILREYRAAREALGDVSDEDPRYNYGVGDQSIFTSITASIMGHLPMIYHAISVAANPSRASLAQISILQQSSSQIQSTMWNLVYTMSELSKAVVSIKTLYGTRKIVNMVKDIQDPLEYPQPQETENYGMGFELRDVSFTYPGEAANPALKNVNLKIKAGQLVVFVGENGGGKSSIIKLLCRLYDTTSGEILVDGIDIRRYRVDDLRKSTATLTQEHRLYPLSICANIGLGNTELADDEGVVREAARLGGALGFIEKLDGGLEKNLTPVKTVICGDLRGLEEDDPLQVEYREAEKQSEVSGGEQQRLVAARTFMRFTSGKIKFVAVDEPSSAIDPQGEYELFKRLREGRKGKTMVFVTHRFGHLTKFADLIVCMKDGSIAEQGTHEELLKLNGEYSKLYNVQARAFTSDVGEQKDTTESREVN